MRPDLFIGGRWRAGSGPPLESHDPATGTVVWQGKSASDEDVADAVKAARIAFAGWSATSLEDRTERVRAFARQVEARASELAETIARETGKPLWDCKGEIAATTGKIEISIRAQAERAGHRVDPTAFGAAELSHRPHGVMAVFGPFNFPAHLPNGHITPALLAGNTVVFKPSELTPGVAAIMVECWEAAGLPVGVLNLVQGARDVGAALLKSDVNGVLFTGSVGAGTHIHRTFAGRPDVVLALEMGGNNPLIAWPPADADAAANLIAQSAFHSSGQRCSCARRLIIPDDRWGVRVLDRLKTIAESVVVGAWNETPEPFMGPLVRERAAEQAEAFMLGLLVLGGKAVTPFSRHGAFVRPCVVDMTGAGEPQDEELFGPLLQVWRVVSFDEAIARANATRFGLSGGLVSDDAALWARVQAELRAGVLNWNRPTTGASSALPFGGPGLSGSGRPSAYYAADYCAWPVATQRADKAVALPAPGLPA